MRFSWIIIGFVALLLVSPAQQIKSETAQATGDDALFELRYTSRDRPDFSVLQDGDTAWGDHVLLNATFLPHSMNVTWSRLTILTSDNENITIVEDKRTVTYDTYIIGKNATASVSFQVLLENGTQYSFHYNSINFANYFKPYINSINIAGAAAIKTIWWSVSDLNEADKHVSDLYITYEGASRWWLLEGNISELTYDWDTIYYYHAEFQFKVIIRDNDTNYRPPGVNESIWPGISDEFVSSHFQWSGWSFFTALPGWNVTVYFFEGNNYTEGDSGNEIVWFKRVSMFDAFPDHSIANYSIYLNGALVITGEKNEGRITISIDGLEPGIYNYTIYVVHKGHSASNTVFVIVSTRIIESPNLTLEQLGIIATVTGLLGVISCVICSRWRHEQL